MKPTGRSPRPFLTFLTVCLLAVVLLPGQVHFSAGYVRAQSDGGPICATNEFQIMGQNWEVGGGALTSLTALPPSATLVNYDALVTEFDPVLAYLEAPDQPVVVLIVDEFGSQGKLAHGDYVLAVATQMWQAIRNRLPGIPDSSIVLDRVEIAYNDASNIGQAVNDKLDTYIPQDPEQPTPRFVLNMSFSLMPCMYEVQAGTYGLTANVSFSWEEFMLNYADPASEEDDYSLVRYVEDILETQHVVPDTLPSELPVFDAESIPHMLARAIVYDWITSTSPLLDTLHDYFENDLPRDIVVSVASAGNFGGYTPPYDPDGNGDVDSFAPGSWPEVISISSTRVNPVKDSTFTNSGGIGAPGEWHEIDGKYFAGTSFAAPVASVWIALMQSTSAITCDFAYWEQQDDQKTYLPDALWNSASAACH